MKSLMMCNSLSEIRFIQKQYIVYLEKQMIELHKSKTPFTLMLFRLCDPSIPISIIKEENSGLSAYNYLEYLNNIELFKNQCLRFYGMNTISAVFINVSQEDILEKISSNKKMKAVLLERFDNITNVGKEIADMNHKLSCIPYGQYVNYNENAEDKEMRGINTNVSIQQDFLIKVVSRDRGEKKEVLLLEAVDNVLMKYE